MINYKTIQDTTPPLLTEITVRAWLGFLSRLDKELTDSGYIELDCLLSDDFSDIFEEFIDKGLL